MQSRKTPAFPLKISAHFCADIFYGLAESEDGESEDSGRAKTTQEHGLSEDVDCPKAWTDVERATADKQLFLWQTEPLWRKNFFVYTLKFRRSVGGFFLHKEDRNSILKLFLRHKISSTVKIFFFMEKTKIFRKMKTVVF